MRIPRALQSIRFRLSLAFSIVVFSVGSFLIAGIYFYQVNSLAEPVLQSQPVVMADPETGELVETSIKVVFPEAAQQFAVEQIEQQSYRRALHQLRSATLASMGVLFLVSFGVGWLFAGWMLKPMERISGVAQDITANDLNRRISMRGPDDELKALADTFDAMLDRLQGAFEDQRRFAHEASHELRNPLAVARTNLELALTGDDEEEIRRAAQIAFGATERMSVLIEDLLEQARQGVPELHHGPADLSRLIQESVEEFRAAAEQRDLRILIGDENVTATGRTDPFADDAEPVVIRGDGPALRRAVDNLVSNAVRLAPEGSAIKLAVWATPTEAVMTVADEGPGIAPEDQPLVFDRFWRGKDSNAGSGLGLSIVRRVVERHGGTVSLESNCSGETQGSVFTLRLPMTMNVQSKTGSRAAMMGPPMKGEALPPLSSTDPKVTVEIGAEG